jgi:hypothetical protein
MMDSSMLMIRRLKIFAMWRSIPVNSNGLGLQSIKFCSSGPLTHPVLFGLRALKPYTGTETTWPLRVTALSSQLANMAERARLARKRPGWKKAVFFAL